LSHIKNLFKKRSTINGKYLKGINILTRPLPRVLWAFLGVSEDISVQIPG